MKAVVFRGIGVDRAIDAVGVDANRPGQGPAAQQEQQGIAPQTDRFFPIGAAMNKNLTVQMGNCNHRKYIPLLIEYVESGVLDPSRILTQLEPITSAVAAYKAFDERQPGWVKVELSPRDQEATAAV